MFTVENRQKSVKLQNQKLQKVALSRTAEKANIGSRMKLNALGWLLPEWGKAILGSRFCINGMVNAR